MYTSKLLSAFPSVFNTGKSEAFIVKEKVHCDNVL